MTRLQRLEAARKTSRLFQAAALSGDTDESGFGLPKSSLDGLRETVLQEKLKAGLRHRLRLGEGEQLDCPGLVKRLGGDPEQFTPVSRVALDPWLRQMPLGALQPVDKIYGILVKLDVDLATRVKGNGGIYQPLPYDGQLLYPSRWEVAHADAKREGESDALLQALVQLRKVAKPLWEKFGEPSPYVALLQADGDRMGKLLDQAENAGQHRSISAWLAEFARAVPVIVRRCRGHCIYSGGDDVLALVPLDRVLACAHQLHEQFAELLTPIATLLLADPPTLSVGIGIQHCIEPLSSLRELAKRAEKLAKGDELPESQQRDSLGIIVQTRAGADLCCRDRWGNAPYERLDSWIKLYTEDQLPDKLAYELRNVADQLGWAKDETATAVVGAETRRILARKRAEGGSRELKQEHRDKLVSYAQNHGLRRLADELLISRWLAQRVLR
jgi:CRISPR-associated protein Cmr2